MTTLKSLKLYLHLVKVKTRREVNGVNTMMGYRTIDIATPTEVIGDEGTTTHA